jgi:hypothetical protein
MIDLIERLVGGVQVLRRESEKTPVRNSTSQDKPRKPKPAAKPNSDSKL